MSHDEVTIEPENSGKMLQTAAKKKQAQTAPIPLILTNVAELRQATAKEY